MISKISETSVEEVVRSGLSAKIPIERGVVKLAVPQHMRFRALYLFLEVIPTNPAEDYELEAEIEFRRNGTGIFAMPCSIASNAAATGLVQKSRITQFANVNAGTQEAWKVTLSAPLTNGSLNTTLTPQKLTVEADEIWLNVLGSRNTSSSFSGWRALLGCRSSEVEL